MPIANTSEASAACCKALNPTRDEIKQLLLKVFGASTHALNRRVDLFHYGELPGMKDGAPSPALDPKDAALASKLFYDPSTGRSYFDPDKRYMLFTANNPLVSLAYAQAPAYLLKIGVPAGVRYLNTFTLFISREEAALLACYLRSQGANIDPSDSPLYDSPPQLDDQVFIRGSKETQALIKEVFGQLKIQILVDGFSDSIYAHCPGVNPEAKFIDPTLAPQLDLTLYSPTLEKNPSAEKKKDYREILEYFDTIQHSEVTDIENDVEPSFGQFYKS
ncbi:MAG: hypothetical protein P4M08_04415 [Oligoflexia bacterium]|nr:hypothetical protein [Oligoflexia bacterium]